MQKAATAITQRQIAAVRAAAWKTLGTARDMPGDIDALARDMHSQECDCDSEPDEDTVIRAAGLVGAGWRRSGDAALRLSELLGEIARAWATAAAQPISTCEQFRWSGVCAMAAKIAEEIGQ